MGNQWVVLCKVDNDLEADLVCSILESEGITTMKKYRAFNIKEILGQAVQVEIWVPLSQKGEAEDILKAYRQK